MGRSRYIIPCFGVLVLVWGERDEKADLPLRMYR